MNSLRFFLILVIINTLPATSQIKYAVKDIPPVLARDADAVIREFDITITLHDYNSMTTLIHSVVTVFNKKGMAAISPVVGYDGSSSVKTLEAIEYDGNGKQLRKFKKRDFLDISATGENLYTDNRMMVLDYTPPTFPFTFEFINEVNSTSTAFLQRWDPSPLYDVSTESASYILLNPKKIPLITRKFNLEKFNVSENESPQKYVYKVRQIPAVKREYLSPHYTEFTPVVKFALKRFNLKGNSAVINNWKDFGLWQHNQLLKGRDEIPEQTKLQVSQLVSGIEDPKEKAKVIYEFMQNKTRYISIQIGIGGWQPIPAGEVDKLGYGDCKGLTNYTKALLKSQGIDSYYTIVDSGPYGRDLDEDFIALQGNHVILTVPFDDEMVFLECTNQQVPFNFIGTHTDGRKAFMVTPEGGEMVTTHSYSDKKNFRGIEAEAVFNENLKITGKITETSQGFQYEEKYELENLKQEDVLMYYKEGWSHLNNLSLSGIRFENDKNTISFTESMTFETDNYVSKAGNRILLNPNLFNRYNYIPDNVEERSQAIQIRRGKTFRDEIAITLPPSYDLESIFEPIILETVFGSYKASIEKLSETQLLYKRELTFKPGRFSNEDFDDYTEFIKEIFRKDKSKIVLIKA